MRSLKNLPVGAGAMDNSGKVFYVYVLRCSDGTLYVGSTDNIERRVVEHQIGKGAKYTRGRGPVALVHLETFETRPLAMKRERAIKALGKAGKERLVLGFGKRKEAKEPPASRSE